MFSRIPYPFRLLPSSSSSPQFPLSVAPHRSVRLLPVPRALSPFHRNLSLARLISPCHPSPGLTTPPSPPSSTACPRRSAAPSSGSVSAPARCCGPQSPDFATKNPCLEECARVCVCARAHTHTRVCNAADNCAIVRAIVRARICTHNRTCLCLCVRVLIFLPPSLPPYLPVCACLFFSLPPSLLTSLPPSLPPSLSDCARVRARLLACVLLCVCTLAFARARDMHIAGSQHIAESNMHSCRARARYAYCRTPARRDVTRCGLRARARACRRARASPTAGGW